MGISGWGGRGRGTANKEKERVWLTRQRANTLYLVTYHVPFSNIFYLPTVHGRLDISWPKCSKGLEPTRNSDKDCAFCTVHYLHYCWHRLSFFLWRWNSAVVAFIQAVHSALIALTLFLWYRQCRWSVVDAPTTDVLVDWVWHGLFCGRGG